MSAPDPWAFQRWAYAQSTGSIGRKAVLLMLATMADAGNGRGEVKQETLAAAVEAGVSTVRGHLNALEDAGLIVRRAQFRVDRGRRGDEFLLLAPWVTGWPDGTPLRVQPPDSAGGGTPQNLYPPTGIRAGGQELPLRNDHLSVSARARSREAVKFNGKTVDPALLADANGALNHYAERTGQDVKTLDGRGKPTESFKRVIGAMLSHPSVRMNYRRIIDSTLAAPWWDGPPSVGVVFGPAVIEKNMARASAPPRLGQTRHNGKGNMLRPSDVAHLFPRSGGKPAA